MVRTGAVTWLALPLLLHRALASHPCEQEVSTACPDRPANELAKCLKTPDEHESATTLSSECTDYVALNVACEEDIVKFCDEAFFSEDTILCLKTWTDPESISPKCADVMSWAIPKDADEEGSEGGPTDELGMSDEEKAEKRAWQDERGKARREAIKKMKVEDAAKEKERRELEEFKKENPEAYAEMIAQQEEEKRQQREFKKRERMIAAALERKKREEAGIKDDDDEPKPQEEEKPKRSKRSSSSGGSKKPQRGSWLQAILCIGFVAAVLAGGYYLITKLGSDGKKGRKKGRKGR